MNTALSLFWLVTAVSLVIGAIKAVVGLVSAPMGTEDESGFHFTEDHAAGRRGASAMPFESSIRA